MKRFDRAVYAMFLLVLLADVARAHASVPVAGDPAGNLILTAAQFRAGSGGAVLAVRRADGSLAPIVRWKRAGIAPPRWSRIPAGRKPASSLTYATNLAAATFVLLSACPAPATNGPGSLISTSFSPGSPSLAIFEHTLSPAP